MAENTVTLVLDPANKTVADVIADGKVNKVCYKTYVGEFGITTKEHVATHVAALTEAANYGPTQKAERKRFQMRVRAGLNYYVTAEDNDGNEETPIYLLSAKGVKTVSEMTDAELLDAIRSEAATRS